MVLRPLKSILLKLNQLQRNNWRCLHKLFSKLWNNQTSGASCLSRCLIYKVHTVRFTCSVSRRVLSLSLRPAFVKNFFQVFSNFFQLSHSLSGVVTVALTGDLINLPQAVSLVKNFFQVFQTFSSSLIRPNRCGSCSLEDFALSQSACLYYQNSPCLSTLFFDFFLLFFLCF